MSDFKDWEDKTMLETKVRHEKQRYYIDLAEDLGDTIQFDGGKATLYIRGEYPDNYKLSKVEERQHDETDSKN